MREAPVTVVVSPQCPGRELSAVEAGGSISRVAVMCRSTEKLEGGKARGTAKLHGKPDEYCMFGRRPSLRFTLRRMICMISIGDLSAVQIVRQQLQGCIVQHV